MADQPTILFNFRMVFKGIKLFLFFSFLSSAIGLLLKFHVLIQYGLFCAFLILATLPK